MSNALPLADLCVVEIGHSLAAPYAGLIFAHLGARVVKIENSQLGDYARGWGPPFVDGDSALFHAVNHGKESVQVDLRDPAAAERVRAFIVENADIVLQNLKPGALAHCRLSAPDLMAIRPSLIVCNCGAFGASGPLRDKPGYDPLAQAYSGMMRLVGHDNDEPSRVPVSINDMGTGMWAVIGVLAALRQRAVSGVGQVVDVSLYETALAWMRVPLSDCLAGSPQPARLGSGSPNIVPYQVFECSDDAILVAAGNDAIYARLCNVLERKELALDSRFATNGARVVNRAALIPLLQSRFRDRPALQWLALLEAAAIPCGPLQSLEAVVTDPQTLSLDILRKTPDGKVTTLALPISFDGMRPPMPGNTPALGEHDHLVHPRSNSVLKQEDR